jgi:hypothetical protein
MKIHVEQIDFDDISLFNWKSWDFAEDRIEDQKPNIIR